MKITDAKDLVKGRLYHYYEILPDIDGNIGPVNMGLVLYDDDGFFYHAEQSEQPYAPRARIADFWIEQTDLAVAA